MALENKVQLNIRKLCYVDKKFIKKDLLNFIFILSIPMCFQSIKQVHTVKYNTLIIDETH
jgi:hypothetical protein